jgi:hypothetical protein
LLLIAAAITASAQTSWGYYGTPYDGGPQHGEGRGDGYGPGYSYARQAPNF